jgi:hypothetical protein
MTGDRGDHPCVLEAARAICQAKCALHDRDAACQELGRCGENWRLLVPAAVAVTRYPALEIPGMLRYAAAHRGSRFQRGCG